MARKAREDMGVEETEIGVEAIEPEPTEKVQNIQTQASIRGPVAIRELTFLTKAQRKVLVEDKVKEILKQQEGGLQGGIIPALIKYKSGGNEINILLNVDSRVVQEIWAYFKENSDMPTPEACVECITNLSGSPERIFKRVIPLNWC